MFQKSEPLGLPRGSVRSLITFMLVGAFVVSVFLGVSNEQLSNLVAIVVGFYFGKRAVESRND